MLIIVAVGCFHVVGHEHGLTRFCSIQAETESSPTPTTKRACRQPKPATATTPKVQKRKASVAAKSTTKSTSKKQSVVPRSVVPEPATPPPVVAPAATGPAPPATASPTLADAVDVVVASVVRLRECGLIPATPPTHTQHMADMFAILERCAAILAPPAPVPAPAPTSAQQLDPLLLLERVSNIVRSFQQ